MRLWTTLRVSTHRATTLQMLRLQIIVWMLAVGLEAASAWAGEKVVEVDRIPWPDEAHSLEMFSALTEGPDGRVYAGTCNLLEKERLGAMLIALDPRSHKQEILADMEKLTGEESSGTLPQSKIHS